MMSCNNHATIDWLLINLRSLAMLRDSPFRYIQITGLTGYLLRPFPIKLVRTFATQELHHADGVFELCETEKTRL